MANIFSDDTLEFIFMKAKVLQQWKFHKLIPKGPIDNIKHYFR